MSRTQSSPYIVTIFVEHEHLLFRQDAPNPDRQVDRRAHHRVAADPNRGDLTKMTLELVQQFAGLPERLRRWHRERRRIPLHQSAPPTLYLYTMCEHDVAMLDDPTRCHLGEP